MKTANGIPPARHCRKQSRESERPISSGRRPAMKSKLFRALLIAMIAAAGSLFAQAPIVIVVADPPGVGFSDPTPAAPVGGNEGTTVGEQRLIALRYAAAIWSSKLESPTPIRVRSRFS